MSRLAIVGAGIAGLGLAYYLRNHYQVTLYEKENRLGGHSHTVDVQEGFRDVPVDTGFMVFNHATYPSLLRLFAELKVPTKKTDMSFSVQRKDINLEYAGASFDRLFGDRKNLFSLKFWRMLAEIDRFNKEAHDALSNPDIATMSLNDYVQMRQYSLDFLNSYLVPMSGAIWSTPPEKMLQFPALTLLRFFDNHGLLGVESQHQWWTVDGGSKVYVNKIASLLPGMTRIAGAVTEVRRTVRGVLVTTDDGTQEQYDRVVLACHADDSLRILHEPTADESCVLSAFCYERNETILHTDPAVMPRQRSCWASWNYRLDEAGRSSTHYWMNSLQNVSERENYFVTLNAEHLVDSKRLIKRMTYHHPLFTLAALEAQPKLKLLNERSPRDQVFFCGSYFGYGFHEDALLSSVRLAELLTGSILCH